MLLVANLANTKWLELVRSIGGSSYCSYHRRRRALELPLQLAEFGENVNKATSSIRAVIDTGGINVSLAKP